jgi:hypothetical protein
MLLNYHIGRFVLVSLCVGDLVQCVVYIYFSLCVSCIFISLLLVTVGIIYRKMGSSSNVIISILFDGENISFDASIVMYINSTNIPPIIIMNKKYENQNLLYIVPMMRHTIVVCISSISPMAIGCFMCVNISLVIVLLKPATRILLKPNSTKSPTHSETRKKRRIW